METALVRPLHARIIHQTLKRLSWVAEALSITAILGGIVTFVILCNAVRETIRHDRPQDAASRMHADPVFREYMLRDIRHHGWMIVGGTVLVIACVTIAAFVVNRAIRRKGAR